MIFETPRGTWARASEMRPYIIVSILAITGWMAFYLARAGVIR